MAARARGSRKGFSALSRGPMAPLVGMCLSVVALTAAVTLGGEDSSSSSSSSTTTGGGDSASSATAGAGDPSSSPTNGGEAGVVAAAAAADPVALPPPNACALRMPEGPRGMSVAEARTLTQIAAVGWQVKAPEEMVARVLDVATAKLNQTPSVTDALDLFTREDATAPSARALAELRALAEPGALTCVFDVPAVAPESKNRSGLTPRTEAMRQGVIDAFGRLTMSGYGSKAPKNSPEAAGRALNVAIPDTPTPSAGWVLAHWLMARGADYKLAAVAYEDQVWVPRSGWQTTTSGAPSPVSVRPGRVYVAVSSGTAASKPKSDRTTKTAKKRNR